MACANKKDCCKKTLPQNSLKCAKQKKQKQGREAQLAFNYSSIEERRKTNGSSSFLDKQKVYMNV
jgi:hypothetical protein